MSIDQLCVNTIRCLSIDGVQKADSGHPGLPLGAAPMAYAIWHRNLKHNPADPTWVDRDRFVLSAGHGSMLLYSLLHLTGYDLPMEQLQSFRQWGSHTPGHPEHGDTPGVETTTGPLGQGFSTAVGMAMAEAHLAARFNRPAHTIVDHTTYVLASDGDMMEGCASESASLAGHLKLGKLICLYDSNHITLAGAAPLCFSENVNQRFEAYGWHVQTVEDGNDLEALNAAIAEAKAETNRPSFITVHTVIGYGSPHKAGSSAAHGNPLGVDEVAATKRALGWPDDKFFFVPDDADAHFKLALTTGGAAQTAWNRTFEAWSSAYPDLAAEWNGMHSRTLPAGWDSAIPSFPAGEAIASRASGGKAMAAIAPRYPALVGGSADLDSSTNTAQKGMGDFESILVPHQAVDGANGDEWGYAARNMHYGIREHAMAAASNGMAVHGGLRPFCATFFNFVDYLKPALRLSALMKLPVIYVFTHDSIGLGEDGPTHQPVEQLASIRAVPNLLTIRPGDANEAAEAWKSAVNHLDGPTALILSRQKLPTLDRTVCAPASGLQMGGYVLWESSPAQPRVIIIGTGSELSIAFEAGKTLAAEGIGARVVSMPCCELFNRQSATYRDSVLTPGVKRVSVEAGSSLGWHRYVGLDGVVVGIDHFGASSPYERIYAEFGFTPENVAAEARGLLGAI